MLSSFGLLLSAALASAATIPARQAAPLAKVLIGAPGQVLAADFDGLNFNIVANNSQPGTGPSWMAFRQPNLLYVVDENSNITRLFTFDPVTNDLQLVQNAEGSRGVVYLEFNADQTRLVGAAFGQGTIDVWDIADGALTLIKQIASDDTLGPNAVRQDAPHPHQALLDNTGRFFAINDLGTDTILLIDSQDDAFEVVNRVRVAPDGCGPRHAAFFPAAADVATHYIVLCELLNLVEVFELTYLANSIQFVPVQTISTFGQDFPPVNFTTSTAGEIVISADNLDVYVSNRNTGNETDSIAHFRVIASPDSTAISLEFSDSISSGGLVPRMFSLSGDEEVLFSTNQAGDNGLLALNRNGQLAKKQVFSAAVLAAGALVASPAAALENVLFGDANFGPQFAMQII